MPLKQEEYQSSYLKALCPILRNNPPENLFDDSGEFYQHIYSSILEHLQNKIGNHTELDINLLFDQTWDKFMLHLRDKRPEKAKRIYTIATQIMTPKRSQKFVEDVAEWKDTTLNWTKREMQCCHIDVLSDNQIEKLNQEMLSISAEGDELLIWTRWDTNQINANEDNNSDNEYETIYANNNLLKYRRKKLSQLAKFTKNQLNKNGNQYSDQTIGIELGAQFIVDVDEIIRALPIIKFPLEPYIKTIATNNVIDAIRLSNKAIHVDIDNEENQVYKHLNSLQTSTEYSSTTSSDFYSIVELEQIIKRWGVYIQISKNLHDIDYQTDSDWQAGAVLLQNTWQQLNKTSNQDPSPQSRMDQIRRCIATPLVDAQKAFDDALAAFNQYSATDAPHSKELAKLKTSLFNAKDSLEDAVKEHNLNSNVLEIMLEGFTLISKNESKDTDRSHRGYTQEEIAKKLNLNNRDEVRTSQEKIARLLVSIGPKKIRNKLINAQWDYMESVKQTWGEAMPSLPRNKDDDNWMLVLHWLLTLLNKQKNLASIELQQAKDKKGFLEKCLIDLCQFNVCSSSIETELQELWTNPDHDNIHKVSTRYQVALSAVQSIINQHRSASEDMNIAKSERAKAHKRIQQLTEVRDIFKKTQGIDE